MNTYRIDRRSRYYSARPFLGGWTVRDETPEAAIAQLKTWLGDRDTGDFDYQVVDKTNCSENI